MLVLLFLFRITLICQSGSPAPVDLKETWIELVYDFPVTKAGKFLPSAV